MTSYTFPLRPAKARASNWRVGAWLCGVALAAAIPRLAIALLAPGGGGDTEGYYTVAQNILQNGCVSLSPPESAACVPHWGGNQPPGYPLFLALTWALTGPSAVAGNLMNVLVLVLALTRLTYALVRLLGPTAIFAGLVLAISPLEIGWPRLALTESLTLAATMWVFAEGAASLAERRIRVVPLFLALCVACFTRYDSALLAIPVLILAVAAQPNRQGFLRILAVVALLVAVAGAWTMRNVSVGLAAIPPLVAQIDGKDFPQGYLAWAHTWNTDAYQAQGWSYPIFSKQYSRIRIPAVAFDSPEERARVQRLLDELSARDSTPFPDDIDHEFAEIAASRAAAYPFRQWVVLPLQRTVHMWLSPFTSFGLPEASGAFRSDVALGISARSFPQLVDVLLGSPTVSLTCGFAVTYRYALIGAFTLVVLFWMSDFAPRKRILITASLAYALVRTLTFALNGHSEARYVAPAIPMIEAWTAYALLGAWSVRRRLDRSQVGQLAALHLTCLPTSLPARLGANFVRSLYAYVARSRYERLLTIRLEGQVVAGGVLTLAPGSLPQRLLLHTSLWRHSLKLLHSSRGTGRLTVRTTTRPDPELIWLFTAPSARGLGCATALLGDCEALLRRLGYRRYFVVADAAASALHRFYEMRGFREVMRSSRNGVPVLVLVKPLPMAHGVKEGF